MIITLVMDQYGDTSNGTTVTAMRFAEILRQHGHTVRIVTSVTGVQEENVYVVPKRNIPIVMRIIRSQGMELAKPDKRILLDAISGSDIVHFFLPFKLAKAGKIIADKYHVASMAAFHLQPENITYSIKMNKLPIIHFALYKRFQQFYDKFEHVHCPSEMLREILDGYHYKANKHVISNGVSDSFVRREAARPAEFEGKYIILMSGRLSREKRQDLIIQAVAASKYRSRIQLVFCGRGPWLKYLSKLGKKLLPEAPPVFKFCKREDLIDTINYSDLYVHASEVELEAISCMEAFSCGLVPVISDCKMSATKQFALTEHNVFKCGDAEDLRKKIDFFIEHPEIKDELSEKYLQYSQNFRIEACVSRLEEVFETVVQENREKWGDKVGVLG